MCVKKEIRKLEQTLLSQEQYIKYLYGAIDGYESEIEDLRYQNSELRKKLKNALDSISLKEEALQGLEKQLLEVEDKNIQLKERIQQLQSKVSMADPVNIIITNRTGIAHSIHAIQRHIDGTRTLNNVNLRQHFDNITDRLDIIYRNANQLQGLDRRHLNLQRNFDNIRAERDNLNQEVVRLQNITNAENYRADNMELDMITEYNRAEVAELEVIILQRRLAELEQLEGEIVMNGILLITYREENNVLWGENGLLEYNRDRLYDRYVKWKQKTHDERIINQNLNLQIIAIQNNFHLPVVAQATCMAYNQPPEYSGLPSEDLEEHIRKFRLYLGGSGIANDYAGKIRAKNIWLGGLKDRAKDWHNDNLEGKNWELHHLASNVNQANIAGAGAVPALPNMPAVRAMPNAGLVGAGIGVSLINGPPAGAWTGAQLIPIDDFHTNQDWSIVGGRPTNTPVNYPSANNAQPIVIPLDIGHILHWTEIHYPTEVRGQQQIIYGTLAQGSRPINSFYRDLERYSRQLGITDQQKKLQFLRGLSPENKLEVKRIGMNRPLAELVRTLEDLEKDKAEMMLGVQPLYPEISSSSSNTKPAQTFTSADIERIINEKIQALTTLQKHPAPVVQQTPSYGLGEAFDRLLALAYRLGFPQSDDINKLSPNDLEVFIHKELCQRLAPSDIYNHSFNVRMVNTSVYDDKSVKSSKKSRKCSECGGSGHTKSSCPNKSRRKKSKKTNYARDDSSDSSSSSSSDSSSDSDHYCYGLKKRSNSEKKTSAKKPSAIDKNRIINDVFQLVLKGIVESFIRAVPKETVLTVYNAINGEFINFKEPILSQLKGSPSVKTREKIWDSVKDIFATILQPMISIVTSNMASNLIRKDSAKAEDGIHVDDSLWIPAGIGIVNRKSASDVVTIKCRVIAPDSEKSLVINPAIFDTGSDSSLISEHIVKRLALNVDKSNAPDLGGVATKANTIGTVYSLGISIYDSDNSKTIEDDFMVIKSDKDFLLLGVPWIDRANAIIDFGNRQLSIPISQRKKITIPISLHKRKSNITSLNIDTNDLKKIWTLPWTLKVNP